MSLILSALLFFSFNSYAQSDAVYMMNTVIASSDYSDERYTPTEAECLNSNNEMGLPPHLLYVVRLSKLDFKDLKHGVYFTVSLCEDRNRKNCEEYRESRAKKTVPLSLGIIGNELGCKLAYTKKMGKNYNFINVRIMENSFLKSSVIFDSFIKISELTNLNQIETAREGQLQVFPTKYK